MKYIYILSILFFASCNDGSLGGVKLSSKNISPIDTTRAVVVNKKYNLVNEYYSIVYKNIDGKFFEVIGKLTDNIYVGDSIYVVYQIDYNKVEFLNLIPYGRSKYNENIQF